MDTFIKKQWLKEFHLALIMTSICIYQWYHFLMRYFKISCTCSLYRCRHICLHTAHFWSSTCSRDQCTDIVLALWYANGGYHKHLAILSIWNWKISNRNTIWMYFKIIPHTIHVWYIYLYAWMVDFYGFHVGKYTSPMDGMGYIYILRISTHSPSLVIEDIKRTALKSRQRREFPYVWCRMLGPQGLLRSMVEICGNRYYRKLCYL